MMKAKAEIAAVGKAGKFQVAGGGLSLDLSLTAFPPGDHYEIARALAEKGNPASHALAAYFALRAKRPRDADPHFLEAGDLGAAVRRELGQ